MRTAAAIPITRQSTPQEAGRRCQARPLSSAIRPGPVSTRAPAASPEHQLQLEPAAAGRARR